MKLLRLAGPDGVCSRVSRCDSAVYSMVKAGTFPAPIKFGRSSVWPDHEIDAIVSAHIAGSNEDEIRALVQRLVEQRRNFKHPDHVPPNRGSHRTRK